MPPRLLGTAWDRSGPLGTARDRMGLCGIVRDRRDRSLGTGSTAVDEGPPGGRSLCVRTHCAQLGCCKGTFVQQVVPTIYSIAGKMNFLDMNLRLWEYNHTETS